MSKVVYKKIYLKDRYPSEDGWYNTNCGEVYFNKEEYIFTCNSTNKNVEFWFDETPLLDVYLKNCLPLIEGWYTLCP